MLTRILMAVGWAVLFFIATTIVLSLATALYGLVMFEADVEISPRVIHFIGAGRPLAELGMALVGFLLAMLGRLSFKKKCLTKGSLG